MRRLGVAAVSAALVGTIAAVMPAGIAGADLSTRLPSPVGGLCTTDAQASCWRATSIIDVPGPDMHGTLPAVAGNKLILNAAAEHETANAVWWNTPVTITGQSIAVSFNAYFDQGFQPTPPAHGEGLTFALVEGDASGLGDNNHPAPVPFNPASTSTEYGAGGNGLGFSGFNGNNTTPGGVDNTLGDKNLGLAVLTSNDDANVGGDPNHDASRVGLLKGQAWPVLPATTPDPHIRTGRWYTGNAANIDTPIYGGRAVPVTLSLYPKAGTPNTWVAHVTVDGAAKVDSDVVLPPTVFMGFTEGTHEFPQRQAISDVKVFYGMPAAPTVTASPNPIDLGTVRVGETSTPTPVTLTNTGIVPATVSAGSTPGGFAVNGLPVTLQPDQSVALETTFSPTVVGPAGGNVSLNVASSTGNGTTGFAVTARGVVQGTSIGAPYNAVAPDRILDTRLSGGPIGPNGVRSVKVTGAKGVPEGAGAVVLNVTVTQPTDAGYITVYPTGTAAPTASNLNFVAGQDIANLVTAKVGTGGRVDIYNFAGNTQVLFDVVGWFPDTSAQSGDALAAQAGGGEFVPLVPDRILDTRAGIGAPQAPLGPNSFLDLQVTGRGGVPAVGVAAVVMNLTGTNTTAPGYLTAWPTGSKQQTTSNLNFGPGQSVPNLAVVPVGTGGKVSIYNFDGATDVLGDVVGYYTAPGVSTAGGGLFHAMAPIRFLDTRLTPPALGAGVTGLLQIAGVKGIPADAVGVVMNVTATNTTDAGFLTVYPAGGNRPPTSSLNFVAGQTVPNLVMSKLGAGATNIYNFAGTTDVVADVVGWYGPA